MNIAKTGAGLKNAGIGIGILVAAGIGIYLLLKAKEGAQAVSEGVKTSTGFLFGADDAPVTLGTWLAGKTGAASGSGYSEADRQAQIAKTKAALAASRAASMMTANQRDVQTIKDSAPKSGYELVGPYTY